MSYNRRNNNGSSPDDGMDEYQFADADEQYFEEYDDNPSEYMEEYADNNLEYYQEDEYEEYSPSKGGFASRLFQGKKYLATDEELDRLEDEELDYEPRDYRPMRFRRDGKVGCLGGMMYALFVISVSIVLACLGWMAASDVLALNKEEHVSVVSIPEDFTVSQVADLLHESGIIEYKFLFKLFCGISDAEEKIDPGSYELSTNYDYRAIITKMHIGSETQESTTVVIPEGYTMKQIFEALQENNICKVEDLNEAAASASYPFAFLEDDNIVEGDPKRLEGYLFPDTYEFYQGEQASTSINRFLNVFNNKITAEMRDKAGDLGYSLREIVTIASLIEREAANDDERAIIASVIYNRLNAGRKLEIDATIQYILPEYKAALSIEDTQIDDPYNTYVYDGLPPGPIANPGIASINAALNPESTGYYFYALDVDAGTHEFFRTQSEHERFVETQDYTQQ